MRIKAAQRIESIIKTDFVTLPAKMPVETARQQIFRSSQTIFPIIDAGKLVGVLSKSDLVNPPKTEIVLVDHNELSQAVQGAEDADIIEVIDHHRLGGSLRSNHPIRFHMEPVGSTCTLVARMFQRAELEPTPDIALCMASGMISDTLFLRSPTTTTVDRDVLQWLQQLLRCRSEGIRQRVLPGRIGSAFLHAGGSRSRGLQGIRRLRAKVFDLSDRRNWLRLVLAAKRRIGTRSRRPGNEQADSSFPRCWSPTSPATAVCCLMSSEPDGWDEINYPQLEDKLYQLDEVVSRKKQLLPLIISLLESSPMPLP